MGRAECGGQLDAAFLSMEADKPMPMAGYKDMADCIAHHQDKKDPAAYCATIMRAVEKADQDDQFRVAKMDPDRNLVFGWASVAATVDGQTLIDKQGDIIPPAELEAAAYDYVLEFREADEMHSRVTKGHLVESLVTTPEKLTAMGLPAGSLPVGWWVGFKMDPASFAAVKAGKYPMFSIEGTAERVVV